MPIRTRKTEDGTIIEHGRWRLVARPDDYSLKMRDTSGEWREVAWSAHEECIMGELALLSGNATQVATKFVQRDREASK